MVMTSCEVKPRVKGRKKAQRYELLKLSADMTESKAVRKYSSVASLMLVSVIACVAWVFLHSGELSRRLNLDFFKNLRGKTSIGFSGSYALPRMDPVKVGYVRTGIFAGIRLKIKTLSIHPPIFEIPRFLSIQDISQILDLAYHSGMVESQVIKEQEDLPDYVQNSEHAFIHFDKNNDSKIDTEEVRTKVIELSNLYFREDDILNMFRRIGADKDNDGKLNWKEFTNMTASSMMGYFFKMSKVHPRALSRNSKQAWIDHRRVKGLAERIAAVSGMPLNVIQDSEDVQVVKYLPGGHYHCHFDSMDILKSEHLPCCTHPVRYKCRLCRYMTILYFLNNVEKGGETAFLMADNKTFHDQEWQKISHTHCDLSRYCKKANLLVEPEKGKAVLWYNHLQNEDELGPLDKRSLHGGCDVLKGEKWVANTWINTL